MQSQIESPVVKQPTHRYLVHTSAGDRSCLPRWLQGRRNFDLWVTYYGQVPGRYRELADYYNLRRHGKFPNLQHVWRTWPHLLDRYDAVLTLDDDIVINASGISRLFDIRARYDLWLLQPAFDPRGKISHAVTRMRHTSFFRYTNFVEVACVMFRKDKLDAFLRVFEPVLVGWGIDWWFLEVLGPNLMGKVAVVDVVTCRNPHDLTKGGQREIDMLQPTAERIAAWRRIKAKYDIRSEDRGIIEYGILPRSVFGKLAGMARGALIVLPIKCRAKWRAALDRVQPGRLLAGVWEARTEGRG